MADPLQYWLETPFGHAIKSHIENGLFVFPLYGIKDDLTCICGDLHCKNAGKHPYTPTAPTGFHNATNDVELAAELFEFRTDLNVGIATGEKSRIFVIDVDNKNNGEGSRSLSRVEEMLGELPRTMTLTTGNGFHLVFDYPMGAGLKSSSNSFGEGYPDVDVRGVGGYIVAFPSRHASGRYYEDDEECKTLADLPQFYIDFLQLDRRKKKDDNVDRSHRVNNSSDWSEEEVYRMLDVLEPDMPYDDWIAVGMALHKEGFQLDMWDKWSARGSKYRGIGDLNTHWRSFNSSGDRTIGTIVEWATLRGWKPLPQENYRMASSAAEAAVAPLVAKIMAKMNGGSVQLVAEAPTVSGDIIEQKPKKKKKEPAEKSVYVPQFAFDPLQLPGALGETVRWITQYAMLPQPELAMLNVLTFAGAVFGRRYMSPKNTRTNMYLVGIAKTGGGKDHSRQMINRLALETGLGNYIGGNSIRSDTGMLRGLMNNASQLLQLDEFGLFMQALSDKGAPHHVKAISRALMSLYSDSKGSYHHGEYADEKAKPIRIAFPNLCIYGTTTESSYTPALKRSAIQSGELNRFIVIPSRSVPEPNFNAPPTATNQELVDWWKWFAPTVNSSIAVLCNSGSTAPTPIVVEWGDCEELQKELFREQLNRSNDMDNPLRDLWSRLYENTLKIAMIFAIAREPDAPSFTENDFDYAKSIVIASIDYMASLAENNMMENPQEQNHHEVFQLIAEAGAHGISRRELLRKFRRLRKKELDDLVSTMVEEEVVAVDRVTRKTGGNPVVTYYAINNSESEPSDHLLTA